MIEFMLAVTRLGSPQVMGLLSVLIVIFLYFHKKPYHLVQFAVFMSLCAASVFVLKNILQIPRPAGGLIEEYGFGFPSGHTTMATIFFLLIIFLYKNHISKTWPRALFISVCLLFIVLISYSRIYLGVHSWVDVIGGYALGSFWFLLSLWFYDVIRKKKLFRNQPMN